MEKDGSATKLVGMCDTLISAGSAVKRPMICAMCDSPNVGKVEKGVYECWDCGADWKTAEYRAPYTKPVEGGSAVKSPLSGSALTDNSEEVMAGESGSASTEAPTIKAGYTVAAIKTVSCSCRCGGETAYELDLNGLHIMLGCACHTWFDASTSQFVRRMDRPAQKEGHLKLRVYHSMEKL